MSTPLGWPLPTSITPGPGGTDDHDAHHEIIHAILSARISVLNYGAKPDDVTDLGAAITAACLDLPALGGIVEIPAADDIWKATTSGQPQPGQNVILLGHGRKATKVQAPSGLPLLRPNGTYTVPEALFGAKGMTVTGDSVPGTCLLDTTLDTLSFHEGLMVFEDLVLLNNTGGKFWITGGDSVYWVVTRDLSIYNHSGGIKLGYSSDFWFYKTISRQPNSAPLFDVTGGSNGVIDGGDVYYSSGVGAVEDVRIRPHAEGIGGLISITGGFKFGPEGDRSDRPRIAIGDGTNPTWPVPPVQIDGSVKFYACPSAKTIASGSNGAALPQATIYLREPVDDIPSSGDVLITNNAGSAQTLTYTGVDTGARTLTGCTGGTGTLATGGAVNPPTTSEWPNATGQKAIQYVGPPNGHDIRGVFHNFGVIVDDNFDTGTVTPVGGSTLDPTIVTEIRNWAPSKVRLFSRGGRGFQRIRTAPGSVEYGFEPGRARRSEATDTRNRMTYSEDLSHWTKSTGLTVTTGQADAYGGTGMNLITRPGSATSENVTSPAIDTTNMKRSDGVGAGGGGAADARVVVKFRAMAGTLYSAVVSMRDVTASRAITQRIELSAADRSYSLMFAGLDPTHSLELSVYPGGLGQKAGTIYLGLVQVSDEECDYVKTAGAASGDSVAGLRLQRTLGAAQGVRLNDLGTVYSVSGVPDNAMGSNGDVAIRVDTPGTANQRLYMKAAGAWVGIV